MPEVGNESSAAQDGSAGEGVLLFEVHRDFVEEEWSEPVQYRFVRTDCGLLWLELRHA